LLLFHAAGAAEAGLKALVPAVALASCNLVDKQPLLALAAADAAFAVQALSHWTCMYT
jgi:hypothetical protein